MLRARPSLNWQILEEEEEWNAAIMAGVESDKLPAAGAHRIAPLAAVCLSLLLAVIGTVLYQRASRNLVQIQTELDTAVAVEDWARRHGSEDLSGVWIDPEAPPVWNTSVYATLSDGHTESASSAASIQDFQLDKDWAMVRVWIDRPSIYEQNEPFLETRFYRLTKTGWMRTAPQEEYWGEEITAETDYFTLTYRQRDTVAVREVMTDIDERYVTLQAEFGLDPDPTGGQLRILVQPMVLPLTDPGLFRFQGDRLTIPSPLQLPALEGLTDADVLRASILEPLAEYVVSKILSQAQVQCQWRALAQGVRLWARQEYRVLPSAYEHEMQSVLHSWSDLGSDRLFSFAEGSPSCFGFQYHTSLDMVADMVAKTVVSFAMLTYGHEAVPSLIEAAGEYDTWEELIPAVFGVSAEEFEQGWQAYLADEYQ